MGDPVHVRVGERPRALEDDVDHLVDRQEILRDAEALHRAARYVLHHDVAGVVAHPRVEDLADVRMDQLPGEGCLGEEELAEKPPAHRVVQRLGEDALHRDLPVAKRVVAKKHLGRRPFAELAKDGVVADLVQRVRPRRFLARAAALRTCTGAVPPT